MLLMTLGLSINEVIRTRLVALGRYGNLTEIADASGVSVATWRPVLRDSQLPSRQGVRAKIARFLDWPDDAFDRIDAGQPPHTLPDVKRTDDAAAAFTHAPGETSSAGMWGPWAAMSSLEGTVKMIRDDVSGHEVRMGEQDERLSRIEALLEQLVSAQPAGVKKGIIRTAADGPVPDDIDDKVAAAAAKALKQRRGRGA